MWKMNILEDNMKFKTCLWWYLLHLEMALAIASQTNTDIISVIHVQNRGVFYVYFDHP